jgi:ABC-type glycerol-3-phosphate transport system substrate-binding protein
MPIVGVQNNPIANELAKRTGVTMNVVSGDAQKFKLLLAGGDLPDIVQFNFTSLQMDANTLISSGQLVELDSLINQYGTNIRTNYPKRLEYSRMFLSNDTGKTYFLPVQAYKVDTSHPNVNPMGGTQMYMLRWDVYAKVGYPEIKSNDDFLSVLKKMQDAYPKTPDGKKVYGISGWTDWGI